MVEDDDLALADEGIGERADELEDEELELLDDDLEEIEDDDKTLRQVHLPVVGDVPHFLPGLHVPEHHNVP